MCPEGLLGVTGATTGVPFARAEATTGALWGGGG